MQQVSKLPTRVSRLVSAADTLNRWSQRMRRY